MILTREEALKLHRQMWSDMQKELGDNPDYREREQYKKKWCAEHFPNKYIDNNCFLCEYNRITNNDYYCDCREVCLIKWINGGCLDGAPEDRYTKMPISKLLALPEREFNEVN